jgi:hypothetical protein
MRIKIITALEFGAKGQISRVTQAWNDISLLVEPFIECAKP